MPKQEEPFLLAEPTEKALKGMKRYAAEKRPNLQVKDRAPLVYSLEGEMAQELFANHEEQMKAYASQREKELRREISELKKVMMQIALRR